MASQRKWDLSWIQGWADWTGRGQSGSTESRCVTAPSTAHSVLVGQEGPCLEAPLGVCVQLPGALNDWEVRGRSAGKCCWAAVWSGPGTDICSRSALRHRDSPLLPWRGGTRLACPSEDMDESGGPGGGVRDTGRRDYTCLQPVFVFLWRRKRWSVKATLSITCAGVKVRGFPPEGKGFLNRRAATVSTPSPPDDHPPTQWEH